ncbi:MAG: ATP-binding cassette domain-containing protein [Dysgonamonadaceae bacterium]|jgi:phosphate transport system ATP-binding protein|nr:ATP-binding cassette domain-containing protein [Dysgonamonadaceae bacterium]
MDRDYILELENLSVSYTHGNYALKDISVSLKPNNVISVIGPALAGKSTLLRSLNRLHEIYPGIKTEGKILFKGEDIKNQPVINIRRKIGMIFQNPNVFPNMSIYRNVLYGYQLNNLSLSKTENDRIVEETLREIALWDEVKDKLQSKPAILSRGQQQQLCIARAIALQPEILLLDNPTALLQSAYTNIIEDAIYHLKDKITFIIATQSLSQAARISDYTLFLEDGELIEHGDTSKLFWSPKDKRTEKFITSQV